MLEYRFINAIFNNPEILEKTELTSEVFDNLAAKKTFSKMKLDYSINNNTNFIKYDYFIHLFDNRREDWYEGDFDKHKKLFFESIGEKETFDWKYVEQLLLKEYKNRKVIMSLAKAIENIENGEDLNNILINLESEVNGVGQDRITSIMNETKFSELYDAITDEINKLNEDGKPSYYTLHLFEAVSKYIRMKKGWLWTLVAPTSAGKSMIMCLLTVLFVKAYRERALFITDENSLEVISTYMHCGYFGIKYYDVEDRKTNLSQYISNLSEEKRKEYHEIFGLIDVIEMPCIPLGEVKKILRDSRNNDNPYSWVILDSFEEINMDSSEGISEVDRYDRNAKECERLAKDMGIILGVTSQLRTDFYTISVEKMPTLCNHQSKTLIKKAFMALLFQYEFSAEGKGKERQVKNLGFRCRIVKCRSGGLDKIFAVNKNFDYCQIIPEKECLNVDVNIVEEF